MFTATRLGTAALAAALGLATLAPRPAAADGAASTRNIIFGAAAVGGTLLILNHNKKVHEKYAEYDRRQAELQSERNNAQAAYESEKQAYQHEVAINGEYQKEVAYQHQQVVAQSHELAKLHHDLRVSQAGSASHGSPFVRSVAATNPAPSQAARTRTPIDQVAYGWGSL